MKDSSFVAKTLLSTSTNHSLAHCYTFGKMHAFSRMLFVVFCIALMINLSSAKSQNIAQPQQAQIQEQIQEIQKSFQAKMGKLESNLKITVEAERKNKDKTRSLTGGEYESAYKKYENEKNSSKELEKYYIKSTQEIIQKAKDSASAWGIESEFGEFEASLRQADSAFLADMKDYRRRLEALEKTQKSTHKKSAYKEKMEWLIQEFDNKYEGILFDAYNSFIEKVGEILGK